MSIIDDVGNILKNLTAGTPVRAQLRPPVRVIKPLEAAVPYVENDVMSENSTTGSAWYFAGLVDKPGGSGHLMKVMALWVTAGRTPNLVMDWYTRKPTSVLNDGVTSTGPSEDDLPFFVGSTPFAAMESHGGVSVTEAVPSTSGRLPKAFQCDPTDTGLYGILITLDSVSGEVDDDLMIVEATSELAA